MECINAKLTPDNSIIKRIDYLLEYVCFFRIPVSTDTTELISIAQGFNPSWELFQMSLRFDKKRNPMQKKADAAKPKKSTDGAGAGK